MTTASLSDNNSKALEELCSYLQEEYGFYFKDKQHRCRMAVEKRMSAIDVDSINTYASYTRDHPEEIRRLLEAISTNETKFHRGTRPWEFLRYRLIPEWKNRDEVNVWSAACSSGEEAYTAAFFLEEYWRQCHTNGQYGVLGSDISREVLEQGMNGTYSSEDLERLEELKPEWIERYFDCRDGNTWKIRKIIRDNVVFREFNLNKTSFPFTHSFNLILCRNVLIYFDQQTKQQVIDNLSRALKPGGVLITGQSENLRDIRHDLARQESSIFRKDGP